jgi:branched-chain amino acid transport system substrate-binding protein
MQRRNALGLLTAALLATFGGLPALAQDKLKVGLILPMTGPFASTGRQIDAAVKLYVQQNGATVAGKTIEIVLRDDTGNADATKRIAQELVVNDGVQVLAGFGLTPLALATAPIATQSKVPQIVMAAATAMITEASPFIARTSFTLPQASVPMADWAIKNGIKSVVTVVADFGPGIDAEKSFSEQFKAGGGTVENLRVPLRNPDFAPFLQKAADAKPEAIFVFVPSGVGTQFMKQFRERGLDKAGVKLIGTGDVTEDDILNAIGDVALGTITSAHYSAAHESPENKAFVEAFQKANPGMRPNFMAVGGYDGMQLLYEALKKSGGKTDGDSLIGAMKGLAWTSPRGPVSIDPETRDIIQNIYIRETKRVGAELYNVEFVTITNVKDPFKAAKK